VGGRAGPGRAPRGRHARRGKRGIGECGAAPLAALRALATEPECSVLRDAVALGPDSGVAPVATEGPTDPAPYDRAM
jgi:hypothetical protein